MFSSSTKLENKRQKRFCLEEVGGAFQIMYTHVSKCKTDTCKDCSWNWGRGNEREQWRGEENSNVIYLIHCKNFCKYSNEPPPSTTIIKNV
jgi:hypothetical protein